MWLSLYVYVSTYGVVCGEYVSVIPNICGKSLNDYRSALIKIFCGY